MNELAQLLSPTFLIVAAGLPFGIGAIIFVLYRRGPSGTLVFGMPLSWAEPIEIRLVLYLIFAAVLGVVALIPRILYPVVPEGSAIAGLLLAFIVIAVLLDFALVYAAAGTLLQAAMGTRGRPPFWFSRYLGPLDSAIMTLGDVVARMLLHQGPTPVRRPPREAEISFENDALEPEAEVVEPVPQPRAPRVNRRDPYAVARERIDRVIAEYESQLTPSQLEKYLLMKEIVEYLKGRD
ncbi:MAG: hypothetical protein ACOC7M_03770 [Chloroflexota bacterium]